MQTSSSTAEEEGGGAVDGDEDGPRRTSTALGRFREARPELQEEDAQKGVQDDGNERTVSIVNGRRRIWRSSPSAMAEQGRLWRVMAAAAMGKEGRNGTLGLRGLSGRAYKGWAAPAGPRAPHATAAASCERGGEASVERRRTADTARWGLARKRGAYRFAPDGLRGEQKRWAEGKD